MYFFFFFWEYGYECHLCVTCIVLNLYGIPIVPPTSIWQMEEKPVDASDETAICWFLVIYMMIQRLFTYLRVLLPMLLTCNLHERLLAGCAEKCWFFYHMPSMLGLMVITFFVNSCLAVYHVRQEVGNYVMPHVGTFSPFPKDVYLLISSFHPEEKNILKAVLVFLHWCNAILLQ